MAAAFERAHAWATLAGKGVDVAALEALRREIPDPTEILALPRRRLQQLVGEGTLARLAAPVDPAHDAALRAWLSDPVHEVVACDDADYPQALRQICDAPLALYCVGRRELLDRPSLAIVGSRHATPAGCDNAREFAQALGEAGLAVVSGLALGIDGAAHHGALDTAGGTIAVVGTGPDRVYPARHRSLAHAIAAKGAMISEFAPGTPPLPFNFPQRNRIISGIALGVLVVEATVSSGSLITARLAGEQGREVFAIPGSIHSPFSHGCHRLIREGAKLVETVDDVLSELHWRAAGPTVRRSRPAPEMDADATLVLAALGHDPADTDTLVARTNLAAANVATALVSLEIAGCVGAIAGGRWQRIEA